YPVQPAISHGEIIKESALKESKVSRTLATSDDALVSFPGDLNGKWASGIMRVRKHAACRDMDGIGAMLFSPLGDLNALLKCVALPGEIVKGPGQRSIIIFEDTQLNAQEEFTANLFADSIHYIEQKPSSPCQRISVSVLTVIYGGTDELIKQVTV